MELDNLKSAWQSKMQHEFDSAKHTLPQLTTRLQAMQEQLQKSDQQNRFWLQVILLGMGVCLAGFLFFRIQYSLEKFPHIPITLYEAGFVTGMVFVSLKLLLGYHYTRQVAQLRTRLYATTLKESLLGTRLLFERLYRLSVILCLVLLPPCFFCKSSCGVLFLIGSCTNGLDRLSWLVACSR
jgi:hypothetical protein